MDTQFSSGVLKPPRTSQKTVHIHYCAQCGSELHVCGGTTLRRGTHRDSQSDTATACPPHRLIAMILCWLGCALEPPMHALTRLSVGPGFLRLLTQPTFKHFRQQLGPLSLGAIVFIPPLHNARLCPAVWLIHCRGRRLCAYPEALHSNMHKYQHQTPGDCQRTYRAAKLEVVVDIRVRARQPKTSTAYVHTHTSSSLDVV